jgi:hypothetical protein
MNELFQNFDIVISDNNMDIRNCNMSLKVNLLFSHLNLFPKNLGAVREEQGERLDQDIKQMER